VNNVATFFENTAQTPLQTVESPLLDDLGIRLWIKRDDLLHPSVSGNKWRKLKYNLLEAEKLDFDTLFTFGGAYSNHIAAVAAAGKAVGFKTIGVIRGDELNADSNKTLRFAHQCGMKLIFVNRESYRDKEGLSRHYGQNCYVLPEGGTNHLAVQGVGEVVDEITGQLGRRPDYLCTAIGTGGTFAGLCSKTDLTTSVLGFTVLKNAQYLLKSINQYIAAAQEFSQVRYEIFWDYPTGEQNYGKTNPEMQQFMVRFEAETQILLDPVYTGKTLFWLYELIERKNYFKPNTTIVVLHTGGLQGRQ